MNPPTHTPAEGVLPEASAGGSDHRAHVELVIQQIGVPAQTAGTRQRGAHHPSVPCAPVVIALRLRLCTHMHTEHTYTPLSRASTPQHNSGM